MYDSRPMCHFQVPGTIFYVSKGNFYGFFLPLFYFFKLIKALHIKITVKVF